MKELGNVDYNSFVIPKDYRCDYCGTHGVKLWRKSHTFLDNNFLMCAKCAGKREKQDVSSLDSDGTIMWKDLGVRTDNIGWMVPAVPTEDGHTYWGYTSVPEAGCRWWTRIPSV